MKFAHGDTLASHVGKGFDRIREEGGQSLMDDRQEAEGVPFIPNGFALLPDGSLLVANMGQAGCSEREQ